MSANIERTGYSPDEAAESTSLSRDVIIRDIKAGLLRAKKRGTRYVIPPEWLKDYIDSLPDA